MLSLKNLSQFRFFIMPTLWRYILLQYSKALAVSLFGFLIILLSTRLDDVAKLVSLGATFSPIILFVFYQIPYVLQVAVPISSLIAGLYLFQKLSYNHELAAIRAAGMSLYQVITPLLIFSSLIGFIFFQAVFDMSARSHLAAKKLEFTIRSQYPLALLQNSRVLEQSGISLDMKGSLKTDGHAEDMIVAMKSGEGGRCTLLLVKKVESDEEFLQGQDLTVITTLPNQKSNHFDHLVIENAKENMLPLKNLSIVIVKRPWKASNEMLRLPLLLAKKKELSEKLSFREYANRGTKRIKHFIGRCNVELVRRVSLSLSIVTLALLGASFGCNIGRQVSKIRQIWVILLAALFLLSYLGAKALEDKTATAITLYLMPHALLIGASLFRLRNIQKGIEG